MTFNETFRRITGHDPMRWQARLATEHFAKGALPSAVEGGVRNGLLLKFSVAVPGPVLLGKDLHYGGGLFVAGS